MTNEAQRGLVSAVEQGGRLYLMSGVESPSDDANDLMASSDLVVDWAQGQIVKNRHGPTSPNYRIDLEHAFMVRAAASFYFQGEEGLAILVDRLLVDDVEAGWSFLRF